MLRPVDHIFAPKEEGKSIEIKGFEFTHTKLASCEEVLNLDTSELYAKVTSPVFQAPIMIET